MKTPAFSSDFPMLELLEPRIAPAVLVDGANLLGGADNPATGETSLDDNAHPIINVKSGMALVWFDAVSETITGISLSNGADIQVFGDIHGDIVTNLTAEGRLSDADNDPTNGENGEILLANQISVAIFKTDSEEGSVGNIVAGGNISKLTVQGKISGIYAGNGVFDSLSNLGGSGSFNVDVGFDINPLDGVASSIYSFTTANYGTALKSGASIANVSISNGVNLQIFAGDGLLPGGHGGSVSNVIIEGAVVENVGNVSYRIQAGDGADGAIGGNGGSIVSVTEKASSQEVYYQAGNGGNGSTGNGGSGGAISKVSAESDQSSYSVTAGVGGHALGVLGNGGNGGSLLSNNFTGRDPKTGILVSGDFTGDGLEDLVVVDPGSGQMALMKNENGGTEFSLVGLPIDAAGVAPKSVLAADIDGDNDLDLIVAYGNSASIGIFKNDGFGVFTSSSFSTGLAPVDIAVGNFFNASRLDIAILSNTIAGASVKLALNDGVGGFSLSSKSVSLGKLTNAVDLVAAKVDPGSLTDLFVGYSNGQITTLFGSGDADTLFNVSSTVASSVNKLSNLDVNATTNELLAFSSAGNAIAVFSYGGGSLIKSAVPLDLSTVVGQGMVARFGGETNGSIQVLTTSGGASKVTEFILQPSSGGAPGVPITGPAYASSKVITYEGALKTFISTDSGAGVAALTGSLAKMAYSLNSSTFTDIELPFDGKSLSLTAGDGGNAIGGKGGLGGAISILNVESTALNLTTGAGGNSVNSVGGAGGAFTNSASNRISVESLLEITTGSGGDGGTTGGNGGAISSVIIALGKTSEANLYSGNGGDGNTGKGGNGGAVSRLTLTSKGSDLEIEAGHGGDSLFGKSAGKGGDVVSVTYLQEMETDSEDVPLAHEVWITGGAGGNASMGAAGAGGSLSKINLTVDPPHVDPDNIYKDLVDATVQMVLLAGDGGNGAAGGAGGVIQTLNVWVTLDQKQIDPANSAKSYIFLNYATLKVTAGDGGDGTAGNGGNGGSVSILKAQNLTYHDWDSASSDPGLMVTAGSGGNGSLAGGQGGSLTKIFTSNGRADGSVVKTNFLAGAILTAGAGGNGGLKDGGVGGSLVNIRVAVQRVEAWQGSLFLDSKEGYLYAFAGSGGDSTSAKGGIGGSIRTGVMASVAVSSPASGSPVDSLWVEAGNGGNGFSAGGAGGGITALTLSTPQSGNIYGATLLAGDGGSASSVALKAIGGAGGSISSISQPKDINSAISLIQAGNGGDSAGSNGGKGGSVSAIKTAGFIGRVFEVDGDRLGVMDNGWQQGIFAGLGGSGATSEGLAGSIANIVARQISALGVSMLPDGTFGLAASIKNVKADLIGYSSTGSSTYSGVSPTQAAPTDGFLLAQVLSGINTYNPTRTASFTFTS